MSLSSAGSALAACHSFRAFNTDVTLLAADWLLAAEFGRIEAYMHAFEARFSRFRPESEVGRINARDVDEVEVSAELLPLLQRCRHFARITDGIFNPLVLRQLEAAGYDRSFETIAGTHRASSAGRVPAFDCVEIDAASRRLRLPRSAGFDFGGVGKGYAVDQARDLLPEGVGFLIDAGGDIYASGCGPDGATWQIDVAGPQAPGRILDVVRLCGQAVATSWTSRRHWRTADGWAHHIIDPRNGLPAAAGVAGATVIADTADSADVFAKTALVLGPEAGLGFLIEQHVEGLLVLDSGSLIPTPGWPGQR
jgi:thiamine biosynthesis lipoprotein